MFNKNRDFSSEISAQLIRKSNSRHDDVEVSFSPGCGKENENVCDTFSTSTAIKTFNCITSKRYNVAE